MQSSPADRSRILPVSVLLYVAMIIAMAWPVLGRLGTSILNDAGDPLLNAAILAWNAKAIPYTDAWWNFPIFFPAEDALTFSEHLLGVALFTTPVNWITGNSLAAYNAFALFSFPLSALSMWALVYRLTRVPAAALLAGLAFGFAPFRIAHLSHVQMLASFWMPLALVGLHAFIETRRLRWLLLFGVTWLLQGTTNGYFLIFFSMFVAGWAGWFLLPARRWRDLASIALAGGVAALPLIPILYRYVHAHAEHGLSRSLGEVARFSADIDSLLCAPSALQFWGWLDAGCNPEAGLFPGAALVAALVAGSIVKLKDAAPSLHRAPGSWLRAGRATAGVLGIVYATIAVVTMLFGPMSVAFGPMRASVSSVNKPLSVALLCGAVVIVSSAGFRSLIRRSSVLGFYASAAFLAWVLSLGPFPALFDAPVLYRAPYSWLMIVPGVDGLRVPARWWMLSVLCLSVVLGLLTAYVLRRCSPRVSAVLVPIVAAGLMTDGWVQFRAVDVAPSVTTDAVLEGRVVLELPAGYLSRDPGAVFRAVNGNWRLVNGYSGYEPHQYHVLRTASERRDVSVLNRLRELTDLTVIVSDESPELKELVGQMSGVVTEDQNGAARFLLHRAPGRPAIGAEIPIQRVEGSCATDQVVALADGDIESLWECGFQEGGESVVIDLGQPVEVASVVHVFGRYAARHPRMLIVETSADGINWQPGWSGSILGEILAGAINDPRRVPAVLSFSPRFARFVRLRQTGRDPERVWSVAEIEVRRPQ